MRYLNEFAMGLSDIFNDAGINMGEINLTAYDTELMGTKTRKQAIKKDADAQSENQQAFIKKDAEADAFTAFRLKTFLGGLSDMVQMYLRNYKDYTADDDKKSSPFRMNVSGDGGFGMKSMQDISFETGSYIPAPTRQHQPDSPDGDKAEELFKKGKWKTVKEPYEYSPTFTGGRNLEDFDADAWKEKQLYQRFDEFGKDFTVPEAKDTGDPDNTYDSAGNKTDYSKHSGRTAGFKIGKDGSFKAWDNYGSEIYLRDGELVLSAPGDIKIMPGKNLILMPGADFIIKTRGDIDLTAEAGSFKAAARDSAYIYSKEKGILLHTDSEGSPIWLDQQNPVNPLTGQPVTLPGGNTIGGEEFDRSKGIVMKADKSAIATLAEDLVQTASKTLKIKVEEQIIQRCKQLFSYFTQDALFSTQGKSVIQIGAKSLLMAAKHITQAAGAAWQVFRGEKALAIPGYQWVSINDSAGKSVDTYAGVSEKMTESYDKIANDDQWLGAFQDSYAKNITFRFRSDLNYRAARNPNGTVGTILYQNRWQLLKEKGYGFLSNYPTEDWGDSTFEVAGTYPWPGDPSQGGVTYVTYTDAGNMEWKKLHPKDRGGLKNKGGSFKAQNTIAKMQVGSKIV